MKKDLKSERAESTLPKGVESAQWLNQLAKVVYDWYTYKKSDELSDLL